MPHNQSINLTGQIWRVSDFKCLVGSVFVFLCVCMCMCMCVPEPAHHLLKQSDFIADCKVKIADYKTTYSMTLNLFKYIFNCLIEW